MVGTSGPAPFDPARVRAYYVHGTPAGRYPRPLLAGGTWNRALAVSPDGNLTLVAGTAHPCPTVRCTP
jgi:hypothetical protein